MFEYAVVSWWFKWCDGKRLRCPDCSSFFRHCVFVGQQRIRASSIWPHSTEIMSVSLAFSGNGAENQQFSNYQDVEVFEAQSSRPRTALFPRGLMHVSRLASYKVQILMIDSVG